jgi:large subunit ribosomal protein L4
MVWLALRSALSDRASGGMVTVVDDWAFAAPKTKDALAALKAAGVADGERVLVVLARDDENAWKSFRNLGRTIVDLVSPEELNTYDVLVSDRVIFTSATLAALSTRGGGSA